MLATGILAGLPPACLGPEHHRPVRDPVCHHTWKQSCDTCAECTALGKCAGVIASQEEVGWHAGELELTSFGRSQLRMFQAD